MFARSLKLHWVLVVAVPAAAFLLQGVALGQQVSSGKDSERDEPQLRFSESNGIRFPYV